jgi:hypothetical protein
MRRTPRRRLPSMPTRTVRSMQRLAAQSSRTPRRSCSSAERRAAVGLCSLTKQTDPRVARLAAKGGVSGSRRRAVSGSGSHCPLLPFIEAPRARPVLPPGGSRMLRGLDPLTGRLRQSGQPQPDIDERVVRFIETRQHDVTGNSTQCRALAARDAVGRLGRRDRVVHEA